ncbi:VWA domain-containing protein [Enterovibrio makurazakiensis]|uniref:hypothetical protein n=1 Tax=Enterovibrio makurazakiensis TaxID=2910232 RepID=UPI003D1A6E6F
MKLNQYFVAASLLLSNVTVASIDLPHPTLKLSESRSLLPGKYVDFSENSDGYPYHDYVPMDASLILESGSILNEYIFTSGYELSAAKANAALDKDRFTSSEVGIHDFYPPYFVKAGLKPTVYFQDFYNPFWNQTPHARQYWLYYINNIWLGTHISDWESVAYFFDKDSKPVDAVYSTHYEANKYNWSNVNKESGSPLIYVSNGGHGSYAHSGETKFGSPISATDYHRGEKETVSAPNAIALNSSPGTSVLNFSAPWGANGDSKAPHGPRLRVDKAQNGWFIKDSYLAKNPYKNCELYPNVEMYGTSINLPEYGVPIIESQDRARSKERIQELLNFGPHRWASGYSESDNCDPIALPQPVRELELSSVDQISVKWEDITSSDKPFGYRLSFYHDTEQGSRIVSTILPWLEACADGICSFDATFDEYVSASSSEPLCVDVEAFHPGGSSDVVSTCEKPSVVLVVDDTGSMSSEINLVKNQLTAFLQGYEDGEAMYQLITFKDNVANRKITRQRADIISAVSSIYASGGGDCPESSGAALIKAAETMAEGASVIFVTDASSNSLADLARAKSEILKKRGKLTTLLSRTCDGSSASARMALTQAEPRLLRAEPKAFSASSTFDGLDWESDFGLENGRVLIENDANQLRYIGFVQDDNHTDRIDNFRVLVSAGKKTLNVKQLNNFGVSLNVRVVEADAVTNRAQDRVRANYNNVRQWMWDFEQLETDNLYIEVTASSVSSTPTEYVIEVIDNPYVGLNDYEVYSTFTNDVNGNFYYVPEIKFGDSTRFAEALEEALKAALTPVISSVSPNILVANNKGQAVDVKLLNVSWTGSESVEFGDETGFRVAGTLSDFSGQLATVNFNVARSVEAKCYNLYVSGTDYMVQSDCVLTVEESPIDIYGLMTELRDLVKAADIFDSIESMLLYRLDIIDVHIANSDFPVAQSYLAEFNQWIAALSGFLIPTEDVEAMTAKANEAIAELNLL